MADEIKVLIEADLTEQTLENIKEGVSDSINKGLEGKEKEFANVFNFKNIKKELGSALNSAWNSSSKVQAKQSASMNKYKKSQEVVAGLIGKQNKGFGGTAKLVSAIGKQGIAGMQGMLANANPYVLAMKAAAVAAKFTADQFVRISKESSKFVGQGSLFADKNTMDMMQRTGQTATQAQATQRSLGDLGLNFEDIQQGKITAEQAAAFEKIRQRELAKLEEINAVAGPMFKSMQQVTLGFTLLSRDINDMITMAMASAPGITSMLEKIKPFIAQVSSFMGSLIGTFLGPIFSIIGDIVGFVMDILSGLMPALQVAMTVIKPMFEVIQNLSRIIFDILGPIFKVVTFFVSLFAVFKALFSPLKLVLGLLSFLNPLFEKLTEFLTKFTDGVNNALHGLFETLKSIPVVGLLFKDVNIPAAAGSGGNTTNSNNTGGAFDNSNTNNYIYGSSSMNQSSVAPKDLFSNSYTLIND